MEQTASSLAQKVESLETENSFLRTQVAQLRDLPLPDVAWHLGLDLDAKGKNRWKGGGHTINIDDYSFYDFSTERGGGGAIDLVMYVRGYSYKEAIAWLSSRFGEAEMLRAAIAHAQKEAKQISISEPAPQFTPPTPDPLQWVHVKNYLTQKRRLPSHLIDLLHERGLLYADSVHNAVFPMRTRDSVLTGAFLRGTKSSNFLGYAPDTKRDQGWFFFQLGEGDGDSIERIVITKSPIDAISYAALHNLTKRTLYLAASGVRQLPPLDYLCDKEVIVAYDRAADEKAKEIKQKVPHAKRQRPKGEDWNADLQELYLNQPPQPLPPEQVKSQQVQLIRSEDNSPVEAYITELAQKHIDDYENLWRESLRTFQTEDNFWDWVFKLEFITRQENHSGYAIECLDITQGLMMVETQLHGSRDLIGKRLVYIEALTSAPWNRKEIQNPPRFKGVGSALLRYARLLSVELGYEGRVGLHSLQGAERFYENQGMFNYGAEEDYDNLTYFEYGALRQR